MKNRLIKNNEINEEEYIRFFKFINNLDNIKDKQLTKFLKWCFDNGFFENISDDDIDDFYEYEYMRLLKNNGITIGIDFYGKSETALIGIDPSNCFDKIRTSSILINLPLSKREEKQMYKYLDKLLDKKSDLSIDWRRYAKEYWYGKYRNFNCN